MTEIKPGDKVHYTAPFGTIKENGIVKSFNDSQTTAWVCYNCGGDWENYMNYTGAATSVKDLTPGWIEKE